MLNKKGDGFPVKVIVVIVLIVLILVISLLFATGTLREVFGTIAQYLGYARESSENIPIPPP